MICLNISSTTICENICFGRNFGYNWQMVWLISSREIIWYFIFRKLALYISCSFRGRKTKVVPKSIFKITRKYSFQNEQFIILNMNFAWIWSDHEKCFASEINLSFINLDASIRSLWRRNLMFRIEKKNNLKNLLKIKSRWKSQLFKVTTAYKFCFGSFVFEQMINVYSTKCKQMKYIANLFFDFHCFFLFRFISHFGVWNSIYIKHHDSGIRLFIFVRIICT